MSYVKTLSEIAARHPGRHLDASVSHDPGCPLYNTWSFETCGVMPDGSPISVDRSGSVALLTEDRCTCKPEIVVNYVRPLRVGPKIGRNEPCPCSSGKKFKKCCERVN